MLVDNGHGTPGHKCLTHCASTFRKAMTERRQSRVSTASPLSRIPEIKETEKLNSDATNSRRGSEDDSERSISPITDIKHLRAHGQQNRRLSLDTGSIQRNKSIIPEAFNISQMNINEEEEEDLEEKKTVRRVSLAKILAPQGPDLVEGRFSMIGNNNFEQFLEAVGTGPLSRNMVMRAKVTLTISRTPDRQWIIVQETAIKAKSVTGYSTCNRKLTQNKFKEGEEKPELLDDWDQRMVITTISREDEGARLKLEQYADKDEKFHEDSTVIFAVDREDTDILIATFMINNVIAWRKFRRMAQNTGGSRRHSVV